MKMKVHNLHFSDEEWGRLKALAKRERKSGDERASVAELVRRAVAKYLSEQQGEKT